MNEYYGPLPKDDDIKRMREDIANVLKWIDDPVPTVLRANPALLAAAVELAKEPNPAGNGNGGGPATPTESKAVAGADLAKELREKQHHIRYLLGLLHLNAGDLMDATNKALALIADTPKPKTTDIPMCAELYCEDPSDGRRGRCEPCDRWCRRWAEKRNELAKIDAYSASDAPPVPREVIDARIKLRENRKVHINGPLADAATA